MPVINRIAEFAQEMAEWRHHLHMHPELQFACHETAAFIAGKLRSFGVDAIHEGIAETGIVALINGKSPGPTVGLRADMDALPITETTGAEWSSRTPGIMHACGHDGHTATLLGAARYLAETRNFSGRVALIFQPAEEGGGGGAVMVREGIMDRFDIREVHALHTAPNAEVGFFGTRAGPFLAAADSFTIKVEGKGGHGALPQEARDPVVAACGIVAAIQTIVSRNHDSADALVVSVTQIHAGSADNVIPGSAYINGTVRSFDTAVRDMVKRRLAEIAAGHAHAHDVTAWLDYQHGYPPMVNDPDRTRFAIEVAAEIAGSDMVSGSESRQMGAEDFSYMLQARPGAMVMLGQGPGPTWHASDFDFNDAVAPIGASFFARLVERALPG